MSGSATPATPWAYYLSLYRGSFRGLALGIAGAAAQCVLVLPMAYLIKHSFDVFLPAGRVGGIALAGAGLIVLHTLNSAIGLYVRHTTLRVTKGVVQRLREQLLEEVIFMPRAIWDKADRAALHASIVQHTERLDTMSNALAGLFVPAAVLSVGLALVLLGLNWLLFFAMLAVLPPMMLVGQYTKHKTRVLIQNFHHEFEGFSKGLLFVVQMLDLVRMQGAEEEELHRQRALIVKTRDASRAMAWLTTANTTIQKTLSTYSAIIILVAGGMAVAQDLMSIGELLAFYTIASLLNFYVSIMLSTTPQLLEGREALEALYRLHSQKWTAPRAAKKCIAFEGHLELREVHFGYGQRPLLRGISLAVAPGEMTAIVGPNGAGKTTVLHLLLGNYTPDAGTVLAEGRDYCTLDLPHLRRQFGVLPQDPLLFPGTICENIVYGYSGATNAEIEEACEFAAASAFIADLPLGLDTPTGEHGDLLSGGQRQRIALARALLRRPKLLILDEPTTHLDRAAVAHFLRTLPQLPFRPAVLCITHDPALAAEAQQVIFLSPEGVLCPLEAQV